MRTNLSLLAIIAFCIELRLFYPVAILAFQAITGSFAQAMGVFAVTSIAQALFEIPTSIWADCINRKCILIVGCAFSCLGAISYFMSFSPSHGVPLLYTGAACYGLSNALFSGNNEAIIYEILARYKTLPKMPHVIGRIYSMGQLALAISGVVACFCLWAGYSYRDLMMLTILPAGIGFILSFFVTAILPPLAHKHERGNPWKALLFITKHSNLSWLALASAIRNALGQTSHSLTPSFIELLWPRWLTPLYRTAQNSFGSLGFWFSGKITKHLGAQKALLSGTILSNFFSLVAYAHQSYYSPLLLVINQIFYASNITADTSMQQLLFSSVQRATMSSLISFAGAILCGVTSILAGYLADKAGVQFALITVQLCNIPIIAIYFCLRNRVILSK